MRPCIAYFVNQYPQVSHTFIRGEIRALERQGFSIERIAVRGWNATLVDRQDMLEQSRTRYVLQGGIPRLMLAACAVLAASPGRFLRALGLAVRMGWRSERPLPYHLAYLAEACRTLRWLQASGATHVHAHFGTNSAEVVMLAHVLGGPPYSFTVHGPEEFDKPQRLRLGEKVSRSAFVVAVSSFGRSQIYRWVERLHWAKVKVIPCGVDPAFHERRIHPPAQARRLVCVGRLCGQKGQSLLIEAAARLAARGRVFELVLVGDGEMRRELQALIEAHSLSACVRMAGWMSTGQVRDEILAARALVLPSLAEGLPVALMEAMALGRPVLTTCIAGIPELVRPGKDGWLFPAGDVDALVAALDDCLARPADELRAMGDAARERVLGRHCLDASAAKLAELFRSPL